MFTRRSFTTFTDLCSYSRMKMSPSVVRTKVYGLGHLKNAPNFGLTFIRNTIYIKPFKRRFWNVREQQLGNVKERRITLETFEEGWERSAKDGERSPRKNLNCQYVVQYIHKLPFQTILVIF